MELAVPITMTHHPLGPQVIIDDLSRGSRGAHVHVSLMAAALASLANQVATRGRPMCQRHLGVP